MMNIKNSIKVFFIIVFIFFVFNKSTVNAESKLTIDVKEDPTFVYVNKSKKIKLTTKLEGNVITDANISYESDNENIALVDQKTGELKGLKKGNANITITAKSEDIEAKESFIVHVKEILPNIETFNKPPTISATTSEDKFDDVTFIISDTDGLDAKNIHFYEGILKNGVNTYDNSKEITDKILTKEPEAIKKDKKKNIQYKYIISKDYLKENKNKLYIKIKDNTGKYFNSHFIIKKNNNHYTFDVAPNIGYFSADLDNNTISFVVRDLGGVNDVKVYDNYDENKLKFSQNEFSSINTLITLKLSDFTEKNGKYLLKIKTQDNNKINKNHAFRLIQLSLPKLSIELSEKSIELIKKESTELKPVIKLGKDIVKDANVSFKSSDTSVATVDSTGKITALKNGSATITATTSYKNREATATFKVNVNDTYKIGNDNNMYYCYSGETSKKVTGLITIKNKTYYFSPKTEKYKTVTHKELADSSGNITSVKKYEQKIGWVKIDNDYYFFNTKYGEEGYMEKGKTIDGIELGKDGKAKISSSQYSKKYAQLKLQTLERASTVAAAITTPNMKRKEKLEKCYYYISEMPYKVYGGNISFNTENGRMWDIELAKNALFCDYTSEFAWARNNVPYEARCCYCASAAFSYLANAVGYSGARSEGWKSNNHSWMRIKGPEAKEDFGDEDIVFDIIWGSDMNYLKGKFGTRPKTDAGCLARPENYSVSIIPVDGNKPIQ